MYFVRHVPQLHMYTVSPCTPVPLLIYDKLDMTYDAGTIFHSLVHSTHATRQAAVALREPTWTLAHCGDCLTTTFTCTKAWEPVFTGVPR